MCYQFGMKPRLFGIVATHSPVVAVLRRGPSDWSQVGRWDPEARTFQPGSWIHSNIYPQRCDLSPDGQRFVYFRLRTRATWSAGPTYIAISRLPCRLEVRDGPWVATRGGWSLDLGAAGRSRPSRPRSLVDGSSDERDRDKLDRIAHPWV
jgi:hypothetical protein